MKTKKPFLIVLVIAFLIRIVALNQSLWLDEGVTAKVIRQFSFTQIIPQFSVGDFHPPLYYLFMKLWTLVFGTSVIALRMPSIIFSLLTGSMIYLIGLRLKKESIGFWGAVFFLFNPLVIYYSQEARMYMMATFFLTVCLYAFLESPSAKKTGAKNILLFNGFAFLAFLTFYGSAFFIGSLYLYLLFKKKWNLFFSFLPGFLCATALAAPLLFTQYQHSKDALGLVVNWKHVLGQANIKNLLLIPLKFTVGRISFYPKPLYYLVSGITTLFAFLFIVRGMIRTRLLAFLLLMPLGLGILFSFFTPLLQYFRFLYLLPIFALLLAEGTSFAKKNTSIVLRIILIVCYLGFSFAYLLFPSFHREDWKSLAQTLKNQSSIYMIPSASDVLSYYRSDVMIRDIRSIPNPTGKDIIVIPYVTELYGYDYQKALLEKGFVLQREFVVREIKYEVWR